MTQTPTPPGSLHALVQAQRDLIAPYLPAGVEAFVGDDGDIEGGPVPVLFLGRDTMVQTGEDIWEPDEECREVEITDLWAVMERMQAELVTARTADRSLDVGWAGRVRLDWEDFSALSKVLFFALHGTPDGRERLKHFTDLTDDQLGQLVRLCEDYEQREAIRQAEQPPAPVPPAAPPVPAARIIHRTYGVTQGHLPGLYLQVRLSGTPDSHQEAEALARQAAEEEGFLPDGQRLFGLTTQRSEFGVTVLSRAFWFYDAVSPAARAACIARYRPPQETL